MKQWIGTHDGGRARMAALTALTLLICACGDAERAAPPDRTEAPGAPARQSGGNAVNAFDVEISGTRVNASLPTAQTVTLSGGCVAGSPLSIGFFHKTPTDADYFNLSIQSQAPVTSGQTGAVPLTRVAWDNGTQTPANMPADSKIRVPVRFEGEGTLTINAHSGRGMAGNMQGVIDAVVTHRRSDERATLAASFDIELACAG